MPEPTSASPIEMAQDEVVSGGSQAVAVGAAVAENPPDAKRQKKIEDDLLCPITLELPFDPVMAEDGRVYERSAIEEHINNNKGPNLKSPFTMEKMGERLVAAIQTKNVIEASIENGFVTGDLASKWKEKEQKQKATKELVKRAEGGDVWAMEYVAVAYNSGKDGFKQDYELAYQWYQKAHAAGSVAGMAMEGEFLLGGIGVAKNSIKGGTYIGLAAGKGSNVAAFFLGTYFAEGKHGYPVDKVMARRFLENSLNDECPIKHMDASCEQKARQLLDGLVHADGN